MEFPYFAMKKVSRKVSWKVSRRESCKVSCKESRKQSCKKSSKQSCKESRQESCPAWKESRIGSYACLSPTVFPKFLARLFPRLSSRLFFSARISITNKIFLTDYHFHFDLLNSNVLLLQVKNDRLCCSTTCNKN